MALDLQLKDEIKLLRKFIKTKDEVLKDELYSTYKTLRNEIVSRLGQVKSYIFKNILLKTVKTSEKHGVVLRMLLISITSIGVSLHLY